MYLLKKLRALFVGFDEKPAKFCIERLRKPKKGFELTSSKFGRSHALIARSTTTNGNEETVPGRAPDLFSHIKTQIRVKLSAL